MVLVGEIFIWWTHQIEVRTSISFFFFPPSGCIVIVFHILCYRFMMKWIIMWTSKRKYTYFVFQNKNYKFKQKRFCHAKNNRHSVSFHVLLRMDIRGLRFKTCWIVVTGTNKRWFISILIDFMKFGIGIFVYLRDFNYQRRIVSYCWIC